LWIFGIKVVSDWCQHCDETVAPVRQRKNAESVEGVLSVGDGGEKPVEVIFVDTLREESNNFEEVTCIGAETMERWGGEGEFDGGGEALVTTRLKDLCPLSVPLLR
jgi:hypothetical protein